MLLFMAVTIQMGQDITDYLKDYGLHTILYYHKLPDTATYCVPYITGTAARNLTQMTTVSTLGSSRHSSVS
jgi:hypothetical protein